MKTLPGIPEVTEEMPFPENDQQMASQVVTHETASPDITLTSRFFSAQNVVQYIWDPWKCFFIF
jgi:hypothetical protein